MKINIKLTAMAFAAGAAIASLSAQASSIDVQVVGTITPGACIATLAGGGTVDYGIIASATLSQANVTLLPAKDVPFSISCDAPAKVAVRAVDNRADSSVPGILAAGIDSSWTDSETYGLGTVSGAKVGGYVLVMKQGTFSADGVAVRTINSADLGTSWTEPKIGAIAKSRLISWAGSAPKVPVVFSTLSGTLGVQAVLNKGSELPLAGDVPLDGSATLELVYL